MIDIIFPLLLFLMLDADMSQREREELTPPLARHAHQDEGRANADRITVNVHHDADSGGSAPAASKDSMKVPSERRQSP